MRCLYGARQCHDHVMPECPVEGRLSLHQRVVVAHFRVSWIREPVNARGAARTCSSLPPRRLITHYEG